MPQCAFCSHFGDLSLEHVFSDWMGDLFTGPADAKIEDTTGLIREWSSASFEQKARVVCEACNNGWMSDIEAQHAKPVMTALIKGEIPVPIGPQEAHSLALFAFKTAVVLDHANRRSEPPFFPMRIRSKFREHFLIPGTVNMWLCGFNNHRNKRRIRAVYHSGKIEPTYPIQMYVLTVAIGSLVFQVLSSKHFGSIPLEPYPGYERLAVPFWPVIGRGFVWPNHTNLSTSEGFDDFAFRWSRVIGYPRYPAN